MYTAIQDVDLPKPIINKVFFYRPIKKIKFTPFNQDVPKAFSNLNNFNLDIQIDYFNSNMPLTLHKYVPQKRVTVKLQTFNPWFTSLLLGERSKRKS